MVISEQLVQEVNGITANESLILSADEGVPWPTLIPLEDLIVLGVQLNVVLVKVVKQIVCSKDFGNFDKLVRIAATVEKRFFSKYHGGKHGSKRPHVQGIVVHLEVNEELRALEISRGNTDVIFHALMVELCESPIDEPQLGSGVSKLADIIVDITGLTFLRSWSIMTLCGLTSLCIIPLL